MIRIHENTLITQQGRVLKTLSCPKQAVASEMPEHTQPTFQCSECQERIVNTDYLTEAEVIAVLTDAPETCVSINLANPIFTRECG